MSSRRGATPDSLAIAARHMAPWYGLTARWYFAMMNPRASGRSRTLNIGLAAFDLVEWVLVGRTDGSGLWWRLPLHVVDEAALTLSEPSGCLTAVSAPRGPLALESTVRWGAVGLVTPLAGGLAVPLLTRRPISLDSVGWPLVSGFAGLLARHIRSRRSARNEVEHAEWLDAEIAAAELMGAHSVAMGADSVVDRIEAVSPLLGPPSAGGALDQLLDSWKASLGAEIAGRAIYLGTELLRWERLHNLDPDLGSRVQFVVAEGDGTELLGAEHATRLVEALDALGLRGRVPVTVLVGNAPRTTTGDAVTVQVGEHLLLLGAAPTPTPTSFDPTSVGFAVAAASLLFESASDRSWAPLPCLVPTAIGYALAAVWSHRRLVDADTPSTRERIVAVAALLGASGGAVTVLTRRNRTTRSGLPELAAVALLEGPLMVTAWSWDRLTMRARTLVAAGFAGTVAAIFTLAGRPRPWRALAAEGAVLVAAFGAWHRVPGLIETEVRSRRHAYADEDDRARVAAHQRGRRRVIELVVAARDEACARLAATDVRMPDRLRKEADRRLTEVDQLLKELMCAE